MKIYILKDPITKEIRYLGITKNPLNVRLNGHIHDCKHKKPTHKINWIKSLLKLELRPIIELLEEVDDVIAFDMEIYWIYQLKSWGFNLTNSTNGGKTPITKCGENNPNYGNKYNSNLNTVKGKILQLNFKGKVIKEYICAQQTELDGFHPAAVGACVRHKRTQYKGFQFIYKKEYDPIKNYKFTPTQTQSRSVEQLDKITKQFIAEFSSASEATFYISGKRCDNVGRVCRGERKSYKGFIWRYKIDID